MIQKATLTAPVAVAFSQTVLNSNFLSEYKNVIGIFVKVISGTFTNGKLKISNGISDIIKNVPVNVLQASRDEINAPFYFFPIFTEAKNKRFDITFEADAVAVQTEIDFNFELTNSEEKPKRIFNFQLDTISLPGAATSASKTIVTDPDFERIKGILLISASSAYLNAYDITVRKDNGEALITQAGGYLFDNSQKLPTDQRFFEVDTEAGGKNIVIEIKKVRAQAVADTIQTVFLLDKNYAI